MPKLSDPIILVVDSDPTALAETRIALDCQKYKVHTAQNFDSAIALAETRSLDLVIADIRLGNCSGIDVIKAIRELPGRSDVPVMFSSTSQAPGVIRRTHEFGAAFHLRKPFDAFVLLELVERALWMPHLVHNHINQMIKRPYIPMIPGTLPPLPSMPSPSLTS